MFLVFLPAMNIETYATDYGDDASGNVELGPTDSTGVNTVAKEQVSKDDLNFLSCRQIV